MLMLRIIVVLFGIGFVFAGVAGFIPAFTTNGFLFGFFEVNFFHNVFHIVSGVLAIMAGTSFYYTRLFFKTFGIIYLIIAILGFWRGDLLLMHVNMADNILHLVIGLIAIYLGFFLKVVTV